MQHIYAKALDLSAFYHLDPGRYPYLLESVAHADTGIPYSILFAFPEETLECVSPGEAESFFSELDARWKESATEKSTDSILPFTGGWFVYLGYESLKGIESSVACHDFIYDFPTAFATRCPAAIIVDHQSEQTIFLAESGYENLVLKMQADYKKIKTTPVFSRTEGHIKEDDEQNYLDRVRSILKYIQAGDVFQVNLSRAWQVKIDINTDTLALYQNLSRSNPAPFACLVHHDKGDIVSSSPERLVRARDGWVETRPIAGTRPHTGDDRDQRWLQELRTDIKEQAEHIMLIDLERNDLGRICDPGSIQVDELMTLESYAHVHHIVSNIRGRLRAKVSPVDILKAVFPGGTITGCPKVRCMEIIAELEQQGRGPYTGSVGYINHDGSMDFNILIRTLFRQGNVVHFRAGAGIVSDSIAERELKETRHKAKGLLLSFEQV